MKTIKNIIAVFAVGLAAVLLTPSVHASGALASFNVTNSIDSGAASIASWPTNSAGTNGLNRLTGGPVAIYNQNSAALVVQGYLVNTNASAGVLAVNLVTACPNNSPTVTINTNGIITQNDWQTTGTWVILPIPAATTNWFNWQTNLQMSVSGAIPNAGFVGVRQVTNNLTATCSLTNSSGPVFIYRKLIPTPLIGQ